jgi:peptidoglycan/xylan/chitin deacetylase (PgdA/CDA1 family)
VRIRLWPIAWLLLGALLIAACGSSASSVPPHSGHAGAHHHAAAATGRGARDSMLVRNATPQPGWKPYAGQKVPILVYHELGTAPASEPYPGLYVSDANFEAEMAWLHSDGYQAVTLDEMMNAFFHGGRLPAKPIVITFDNGYIPQATFAPSVMSRYGWPGVLNEITENHLANWRLEKLIRMGWEIDSHSTNHMIALPDATPAELHQQVFASRAFLRDTFHIPVDSFCYPSNQYDATVIAAVKAAGYTNALTENPGFATPQTDPYLLPRFEIEGALPELQADLASGG